MSTSARIARALMQDMGFQPLAETNLETTGLPDSEAYTFVGVREYWGSIVSCALLSQAVEDEGPLAQRISDFYTFTRGLKAYAGSVGFTKLGTFGLLAVLMPGPCSDRFRDWVASQKRGSAWRKDYCLVWLLDQSRGEVFTHRGLPLTFYPKPRFFRELLASEDAAAG